MIFLREVTSKAWELKTLPCFSATIMQSFCMDLSPNIFHLYAPIKLISLNHAFVTLRNGRRCRSKNYVKFAKEIGVAMGIRGDHFKLFNEYFNPLKHEVHGYLEYYTTDLYTKKGTISKNSSDIDNVSKPLLDNVLTGSIDDSQITRYEVRKIQADQVGFFLRLEIVERTMPHFDKFLP